jgi:hypothetical protein
MAPQEVLAHLTKFLATVPVQRLCQNYRTEPRDAMGELYVRLIHLANGKQIRKPADWVFYNGMGLLRNWLRREVQTLL